MRAVPGRPGEIANPQDSSTSDFGHRHPVQHAILSENQASPPACRLLLWQPEELLQVREIVVRATMCIYIVAPMHRTELCTVVNASPCATGTGTGSGIA